MLAPPEIVKTEKFLQITLIQQVTSISVFVLSLAGTRAAWSGDQGGQEGVLAAKAGIML